MYIGEGQSNFDARGDVSDLMAGLASFVTQQTGTLMAGVRAHVGEPDLPFVIGELSQSLTSTSNGVSIAMQAQFVSNLEIGFVSSVGLATPLSTGDGTDGTHFDAAGQIELGLRYATELAELINDGVPPPSFELVTFDLDNTFTPGQQPLGPKLDTLDEPGNPISASTATVAGITVVATAESTFVV